MNNIYDNKDFFNQYAQMERSKRGLTAAGEWHQFKDLIPNLQDKTVLDLGCGYGWHCKYAAEHGAKKVLGIDLSKKMIDEAISKNNDERIEYRVCGLDGFDYPSSAYDCVISNLVLHYVKDLNEIYKKVYQTLRKNGAFLINIEHPVFTSGINQDWIYNEDGSLKYWAIDNYFYPGERQTNFLGEKVIKQHHTLTQIVMGLINAGFRLDALEEAVPSDEMINLPGMADEMRRPMMLIIKAIK